MIIRGYAVPFDTIALVDAGVQETIAPGAMSTLAGPVQLLFGNHHGAPMAWTGDGSLRLWTDETGLAFEARLDPDDRHSWSMYRAISNGAFDGCSVNLWIRDYTETLIDGVPRRRIRRASIDHIAVVNSPAYRETAVWVADADLDELPPRVRAMAAAWQHGRAARTQRTPASAARSAPGHFTSPRPPRELLARIDRIVSGHHAVSFESRR